MVSKPSILRLIWAHHYPISMTQPITIIDIRKKKSSKVSMGSFKIGESIEEALRKDHLKIARVQIALLLVKATILEAHPTRQISLWRQSAREYNQLLIRHPVTSTMPPTNNQTFSIRVLILMEEKRILTGQSR